MSFIKLDEIAIPIFDGADYKNWKIRIMKFLEFKRCKIVALRDMNEKDTQNTWTEMDIKATNYIYSAISNRQFEYISDEVSAYKIITKFDQMYLNKSTALQIVYRNNLENLKLKNFPEVTSFFDAFEKTVNELKSAGAIIAEKEKLKYMLRALPPSYAYIGDLIDMLKEEDQTVEYLKNKIKMKAIEEKNQSSESSMENSQSNSSAFVTEVKPTCFTCGKVGHKKSDCYQNVSSGQRGRGGQSRGRFHVRRFQRGGRSRGACRAASNSSTYSQSQHHESKQERNTFMARINVSEFGTSKHVKNVQHQRILH